MCYMREIEYVRNMNRWVLFSNEYFFCRNYLIFFFGNLMGGKYKKRNSRFLKVNVNLSYDSKQYTFIWTFGSTNNFK